MMVLCQPSIDGLVGQVVNLSLDRMPSRPTYQTNIDSTLVDYPTFCFDRFPSETSLPQEHLAYLA
jgi:hypothetical protein